MKRINFLVFLFIVLLPLVYILYLASSLIALLFEDGLRDSVTFAEVERNGNQSGASHPIPKIIHQTWKNDKIPEQWQIAQFTWYVLYTWKRTKINSVNSLDMHPDYHYMVISTLNLLR